MALSGRIINNRFQLFEKIRVNDFAEYYRAFDRATGNDAICTFYSGHASSRNADDVFRFKLDAKKIAGKEHSHCACPHEVGTLFDICYQATPFFDGPTLSEIIQSRTSFSHTELLSIARDISHALAFLYACGIRHLGLDPSHIVLFREKPVIIDVGAAHLKKFETEEVLASRLNYISPEETGMTPASPDARSDLFSLGTILFHLSTGIAPFAGPRITATLHNIISKKPDFSILEKRGFPPEFISVIKRLLARDMDGRYQSAESLKAHLDALLSGNNDFSATLPINRSTPLPFEEFSGSHHALYAYDKAQSLLKKIAELSSKGDGTIDDEALRETAHIHLITGNYSETIRICNELYSRTNDALLKAEIIALEMAAHFRRNDWQKCIEGAIEGLGLFGEKFPKGGFSLWLRCLRESALFLVGFIIPPFARKNKNIAKYKSILAIYETLIEAFLFRNMGPEFVYASIRMNVISRWRLGPSKELAISIIGIALVFMGLGIFSLSRKLFSRALDMSLKVHDRWSKAYALGFLALVSEFSGNYHRAIDYYYPASLRTFTEIGDIKNIGIIHIGLVQSFLHLSDYERALSHNEESHRIAVRMDDSFFAGMALVYFARIAREKGEFEKAKEYAEKAIHFNRARHLDQNLCAAIIERGCLSLEANDHADAIARFEEARRLDRKGYFSPQHVAHLYPYRAEAYAKAHLSAYGSGTGKDKKMLRKAIKATDVAMRKTLFWPSLRSKAYRAKAIVAFARGNFKAAIRFFEKSIAYARKLGGRFDEAMALLEYALLFLQTGNNEKARERLERAYDIFSTIGSKGYMEICGRLLGIKIDAESPLNTAIQHIRQSILREAGIGLAAGMYNKERLDAMMNSIYEYLGAEEAFCFDIRSEKPIVQFSFPNSDEETLFHMAAAAEEYLRARADGLILHHASHQSLPEHYVLGSTYSYLPLGSTETIAYVCALKSPLLASLKEDDLNILKDIIAHALALSSQKNSSAKHSEKRIEISETTLKKLERAIAFIQENYLSDISREGLAAQVDLSPNYFSALFAEYTGKKLNDYINDLRIIKAAELLKTTNEKVIDIACAAGFENLRTFNRAFKKKMGITPQEYRGKK